MVEEVAQTLLASRVIQGKQDSGHQEGEHLKNWHNKPGKSRQ